MQTEVSALVHLQWVNERPVENVHIGSGVFIKRLEAEWLDLVKSQCPKVEAREQIEFLPPYTHRFFYKSETEEQPSDHLNLTTHQEKQPILRAIVLSRLVKPTSIAYDSVWVKSFYHAEGRTSHYHNQVINNLNVAFLTEGAEDWNTITEADASVMADLWGALQFFLDDTNGLSIDELCALSSSMSMHTPYIFRR